MNISDDMIIALGSVLILTVVIGAYTLGFFNGYYGAINDLDTILKGLR